MDRRQTDQMVQAARSGVRNISEGSGAAATSRKTELKLTNVARASLNDELLHDFEAFLLHNNLRLWPRDSREGVAMRARLARDVAPDLFPESHSTARLTGLLGLSDFVAKAPPEIAANAIICAIHQASYLLRRQMDSQSKSFLDEGGFTENLFNARSKGRNRATRDVEIEQEAVPECPLCSKPMALRTAGRGPRLGSQFWGCSGFPNCRGTRPC